MRKYFPVLPAYPLTTRSIAPLVFACGLIVLGAISLMAQDDEHAVAKTADASVSPSEFQSKVADLRQRLDAAGEKPTPLADLLLQRLRDYRSVTVATVDDVLHGLKTYESKSQMENDKHPAAWSFPETKRLIDAALPFVKDTPQIQAEFLLEKAKILEAEGDLEGAASTFQKAADATSPLGIDVDIRRLQALAASASSLARLNHKSAAEKAYRSVLAYDWYKVQDPAKQRPLKELYLEAGRGLIEVSRHDLKALKEIFFIPATMDELGPLLQKAVKEAQAEQGE